MSHRWRGGCQRVPGTEPEAYPSLVQERATLNFMAEMMRTTAAHQLHAARRTLYQECVTSPEYIQMEQDQEEVYRQMEEDREAAPSNE